MSEKSSDVPADIRDLLPWVRRQLGVTDVREFGRRYAVVILFVGLALTLSIASEAFLRPQNLLNILSQSAPLVIIATAGTLVIIAGGFDLSTGAIFGVVAVASAWTAVNVNPVLALLMGPAVGLALGTLNGLIITVFAVHSFLATLATSLVFRGLAIFISGGFLIPVTEPTFKLLGQGAVGPVSIAVFVLFTWTFLLSFGLRRTTLGRYIFAVGGNAEAAELSGVAVRRIQVVTFAFSGLAAGIASAISTSKIATGQATAGSGLELQAIAAVVLGGTSILGGEGAVWRSVLGVLLLALIGNGFNLLNADPFLRDLTTGLVIIFAVALSAGRHR